MKYLLILFLIFNITFCSESAKLILRCDDIGYSKAGNIALERLLKLKIPISVSLIVNAPYYKDAIELLRKYSHISIGVHLTLTSEWKNMKWGPILNKKEVPTLVDSLGFFLPSKLMFFSNNPSILEIEKELSAQIEVAKKSGLKIDYIDSHMGVLNSAEPLLFLQRVLAAKYNLKISGSYNEKTINEFYFEPPITKKSKLLKILDGLKKNNTYLLVCHIGLNTSELKKYVDLNQNKIRDIADYRYSELLVLSSQCIKKKLKQRSIRLVSYKEPL